MHSIKLTVDDNIYNHIMFLLNNLSSKGIIIEDLKSIKNNNTNKSLDFSKYQVKGLKDIDNPVLWQKEIRDKWN